MFYDLNVPVILYSLSKRQSCMCHNCDFQQTSGGALSHTKCTKNIFLIIVLSENILSFIALKDCATVFLSVQNDFCYFLRKIFFQVYIFYKKTFFIRTVRGNSCYLYKNFLFDYIGKSC